MTLNESDLTWPSLLAHWTAFAQSSVALPKSAEGERWRAAVAPIIGLQAVTFALGDMDKLTLAGERAAGLDKAEVLLRTHTGALHALWRGEGMPDEIAKLIHDAGEALNAAREGGVEWRVTCDTLVCGHPGDMVADLIAGGFAGDLYLPVAGAALFRESPAAFARGPSGERPDERVIRAVKEFLGDVSRPQRVAGMRQVYRQFDFGTGRVVRDLVVPMNGPLTAGQAQLIPAVLRGVEQLIHLPIPGMSKLDPVPVVFAEPSELDG